MKQILVILALALSLPVMAQEDVRGTSRDFWNRPITVQTGNILPRPTYADALMGFVGGRWAPVRLSAYTVSDTTNATGDIVVAHGFKSSNFTVTATPVGTAYRVVNVVSKNDTTFVLRVYDAVADTVLKTKAVTVGYIAR
jgi:hypothetical protein